MARSWSNSWIYLSHLLNHIHYQPLSIQWEFQDPKMEVLYHVRADCLGIFPYKGLKQRLKIVVGTTNKSVPEMHGHWSSIDIASQYQPLAFIICNGWCHTILLINYHMDIKGYCIFQCKPVSTIVIPIWLAMAMVDTGSFNTQMVDKQLSYWPLIPIWSHMIIDQHLCTDALLQPPCSAFPFKKTCWHGESPILH